MILESATQLERFSLEDASRNMAALSDNSYPGRLVAAGINDTGDELHVVTATMGRSPSSQARVYEQVGDSIVTTPLGNDPDPLTIYRTMTRIGNWHIATNGDQTDTIFDEVTSGITRQNSADYTPESAQRALLTRNHEPDPNHTPRISLLVGSGQGLQRAPALFSIIRNNHEDPNNPVSSQRRFYSGQLRKSLVPSTGYAITTYEGDGDPLPPFEGGPRPVQIGREAEETAELFASVLDATGGFLVSAAVKAIHLRTGRVNAVSILNKYGPSPNYPTRKAIN